MVRERTVQRRLGGRGWAAVALVAAVTLPVGAKLARGDDRAAAAAQPDPASTPRADLSPSATGAAAVEVADPRDLTGAPPSASVDAESHDPDRSQSAQEHEMARLEAELEASRRNVERFRRQLDVAKSRPTRQQTNNPIADTLGSVGAGQPVAPETAALTGQGRTTVRMERCWPSTTPARSCCGSLTCRSTPIV